MGWDCRGRQSVSRTLAGLPESKVVLLGASQSGVFHDIAFGSNAANGVPGYSATTGWDFTTGWGTPNLGKLISALAKQQ